MVIGILAAITIVGYTGVTNQARIAATQSAAGQAGKKMVAYAIQNNDTYPATLAAAGISNAGGTTYQYSVNNSASPRTFCVTATRQNVSYYTSNLSSAPTAGACPGHTDGGGGGGGGIADGDPIQTITNADCPTTRTRAVDARDNHTYWVQKLADGKCWMLTNLAYAGGGANTYSDIKTLSNGTADGSTTYTLAKYYVVPSTTNYTTEPTAPSTSTNGTGQYGYLYNWCGAMGGQSTAACANATTPAPSPSVSVCPSGWRLPTGDGGEFGALNTAVNGGTTSTNAGLRSAWFAQYGGFWLAGFVTQGNYGFYWSSSQSNATNAYILYLAADNVSPADSNGKDFGFAIRCVAS